MNPPDQSRPPAAHPYRAAAKSSDPAVTVQTYCRDCFGSENAAQHQPRPEAPYVTGLAPAPQPIIPLDDILDEFGYTREELRKHPAYAADPPDALPPALMTDPERQLTEQTAVLVQANEELLAQSAELVRTRLELAEATAELAEQDRQIVLWRQAGEAWAARAGEIAALRAVVEAARRCVRPVIPPANEKLWELRDAILAFDAARAAQEEAGHRD